MINKEPENPVVYLSNLIKKLDVKNRNGVVALIIVNLLVILLFVFWSTDSLKMLDLMWIQVAIIFSCLPVAATVFPVSQYYKAYVLKTSSAIIVTTVISILTIPILLLLVINKNIYNYLQLLFS